MPSDDVAPRRPQSYRGRTYAIEPDASAASYFFAAAAIAGGSVTVEGLSRDSLQGDVAFCDCLRQMGCEVIVGDNQITVTGRPLRGIDVDMNAISDTVQTLSAAALFAEGPTTIRNVATSAIRKPIASRPWPPSCASSAPKSTSGATGCGSRPGRCTARPSIPTTIIAWP